MSEADKAAADSNADDKTEKQKKVTEKLQAMGMMPGADSVAATAEKKSPRFPKFSTVLVVVIVVAGAMFWVSQNKHAEQDVARMQQNVPVVNNSAMTPASQQVMAEQHNNAAQVPNYQNAWQSNPYAGYYPGSYQPETNYNYNQYPDNHNAQMNPPVADPQAYPNTAYYAGSQPAMYPNHYGYPQQYNNAYQWPQMPPQAYYNYPPNYYAYPDYSNQRQPAAPEYGYAQPYQPQQYNYYQ